MSRQEEAVVPYCEPILVTRRVRVISAGRPVRAGRCSDRGSSEGRRSDACAAIPGPATDNADAPKTAASKSAASKATAGKATAAKGEPEPINEE
jgi:hypothetical protein